MAGLGVSGDGWSWSGFVSGLVACVALCGRHVDKKLRYSWRSRGHMSVPVILQAAILVHILFLLCPVYCCHLLLPSQPL